MSVVIPSLFIVVCAFVVFVAWLDQRTPTEERRDDIEDRESRES